MRRCVLGVLDTGAGCKLRLRISRLVSTLTSSSQTQELAIQLDRPRSVVDVVCVISDDIEKPRNSAFAATSIS